MISSARVESSNAQVWAGRKLEPEVKISPKDSVNVTAVCDALAQDYLCLDYELPAPCQSGF